MSMTRPSSKTVVFLAALGLALTCARTAQAADQKAMLAKIKAHYQVAAEAYDDGNLPKTQSELQQALKLADENGLGGNKLVAQTYVLFGVLEVAGLKETAQGVKYFAKALDISPAIQVPPTMASKAVVAAFARAENQEGDTGSPSSAAADAKAEEEALAPPKPAEPAKPTRAAKSDRLADRAARSADRQEAPRSDPQKEKLVDDLAAAKVSESLQQAEKDRLQREKQEREKELAEAKERTQELTRGKADQEKQIAASQAGERKEREAKEKLARDKAESDRQVADEKRNLLDLTKQKAESDKQLAATREELKKERDAREKLTAGKTESDHQVADEKRNLVDLTKQKADADRQLAATREEAKREREAKEKLAHDKADVDKQLADEKRNLLDLTKQKAESDRQLAATREELKKERDVREKLAASGREANARETERKSKEQQDRAAHEKLAEGPELPGHISEPIACTVPDEVPPGTDLYVHCVPKPGLEAKVVALYYRAGGTVLYNVSTMDRSKKGWYTALIPGGKISGKVLHYYVEARDGRQDVVGSNGRANSPNIATVRAGKSR